MRNTPTFIGIGPGRTGTSMIYQVLREHPDVCMAHNTKETSYFDLEYHRGQGWYNKFFEKCASENAVGEITTNYFYNSIVAERIATQLPDVRLFSILRHPYQRLRSVYLYRQRSGELPQNLTLEEALSFDETLITHNQYASCLANYDIFFEPERLAVWLYDDLERDPDTFINNFLSFIGVSTDFKSDMPSRRVNSSATVANPLLRVLTIHTARSLRRLGFYGVLDWLKRNTLVRKMVLSNNNSHIANDRLTLSSAALSRLHDTWDDEITMIEHRLHRDLSHWRMDNYNILPYLNT